MGSFPATYFLDTMASLLNLHSHGLLRSSEWRACNKVGIPMFGMIRSKVQCLEE